MPATGTRGTTAPGQIPCWIIVVAASLGGLKAVRELTSGLPVEIPAAVVIVQHLTPTAPSHLAEILGTSTALPVKSAEEGEMLRPGTIYIAPPGRHILISRAGRVEFSDADPVQFVRPAASLLFTTAAERFEQHAIAVVLSGRGRDGAAGALSIKEHGGTVIAQDEATSDVYDMPLSAIRTGAVDSVLPLNQISGAIGVLIASG
jgi:two-component system chemotaxis response regulator CheB